MKRVLASLLVLTMLLTVIPLNAVSVSAESYYEDGYTYEVHDGEATITDYDGPGGDITIPSTFGGYPVTAIGEYAFGWYSLTSVDIPYGVVSIGDGAFVYNSRLASVTIPNSVKTIGSAFGSCDSLADVTIPASVETIEPGAFMWCNSLTAFKVDSENKNYFERDGVLFSKIKIGETKLFQYPCGKTGPCDISEINVYNIEDYAFHGSLVSEITFPRYFEHVGKAAFYMCRNLTAVNFQPDYSNWWEVTFGEAAFYGCTALTKFSFTGNVRTVSERMFADCTALEEVTIPDGITSIGNDAFSGCISLSTISLSESVTSIGDGAFYGCTSLSALTLPESVTSIGEGVFEGCSGLTYLSPSSSIDTITENMFYGLTGLTELVIPEGVTTIESYAFWDCENLSAVTIPESIESIDNWVFPYYIDDVYFVGYRDSYRDDIYRDFYAKNKHIRTCSYEHYYSYDCDTTCSNCEYNRLHAVPHTYDDSCDGYCNVCNFDRTDQVIHNYFSTVSRQETCGADGERTYTCSLCGFSYVETIPATGNHSFVDATCTTPKTCTVCGVTEGEALGHDYVGVITKPTCTDDGYTTYTCTVCNDSYIADKVAASGHDYDRNVYNPDCVNGGYTVYTCSDCWDSYIADRVDALGHVYDNVCDTACNRCDATRTITHAYSNNCDTTCNVCDYTRTVEPHPYDNACDTTCNECGYERAVDPHPFDNACDAFCNECGYERTPDVHKSGVQKYTFTNDSYYPFKQDSGGGYYSTNKTNNSSATATLTAMADTTITIRYYTSTESDYDKLIIKQNSKTLVTDSGITTWQIITFSVQTGDTITINYSKDSSQSSGKDAVYFELEDAVSEKPADEVEPTCTEAVVCNECGVTVKEALGHDYDGICDENCNRCGEYRSVPEHTYDHDCDTICNGCGYTRTITHDYAAATCILPETCTVCGVTRGEALGHNYADATCETPKTCTVCKATTGIALGHTYTNTCDTTCDRLCGYTRTITHKYAAATCTVPKTCTVCKANTGKALGHTYTNACDKTCNRSGCGHKRPVGPHKYTSELCDKDCNVCGATRKPAHLYTDSCDIDCNLCRAKRKITHTFSNNCDEYCNVCGEWREAQPHKYSHRCDRDCDECDLIRTVTHKYSNKCDNTCNYCGSKRKVAAHVYKSAVGKAATLTANGYTIKTCTNCKKTTGDKTVIRKVGHMKLSATAYTYNGSAKKPTVTVKDSMGNKIATSNYTVTYATGRKNVGTYKVTIKFKGNYSGTKTLTFKINPAGTTVKSLTAGTKKLTVAITKKIAQVTGYEIQYATNKSFKSAKTKTLSSYKKTSLSLTGLKAKTTYYVRVRTYKTVNGKKVYSAWSTVKSAKTK